MPNAEIKAILHDEKIAYWEIGQALGCHENTILRKMRTELSESDRTAFEAAIAKIKATKNPA